ncbi:MAG TPA: phosphodiester glycosidase family protein [Solirubrobacteraceae bacterium]|nr:phosphodiester glycosidase family protein [Solirubrobacteraceae bacterium]
MSVQTNARARPAPARRRPPAHRRPSSQPRRRRFRRILTIAALLALLPALISYANMVATPSNSSLSINSVEWLRQNGMRGFVNRVESIYYSMTAPSTGGPALKSLPHQAAVAAAAARARQRVHYYLPHRIRPVIHPALPGEGVWKATFAGGGYPPPVMITSFRPSPLYPQLVAGVAWINTRRTSIWLYPGMQEPAVTMPSRGPEEVPMSQRSKLVATFNSAFKLQDSGGGFVSGGHTYAPMKNGLATIVRYKDGRMDIMPWSYGPNAPSDVIYARQNLPLIVNNSKLNPNLSDGPEWGATLGNAVLVWRSGLGIDKHGNLIYAAANDQTVASLAQILKRAGAVRAMELDINSYWPSFITYQHPGARNPANLLPDMARSPFRYLTPDDRDFFAVYLR